MTDEMPWIVVGPQGVKWYGPAKNENDAWQVALGWPSDSEINHAKASGWYAAPAVVSWKRPSDQVRVGLQRGCSECGAGSDDTTDSMTALYCVRCWEKANTTPPVAWAVLDDEGGVLVVLTSPDPAVAQQEGALTPLYLHP